MKRLSLGLWVISSGCAASVWDARVYSCEEVREVSVTGSTVVVERGDDGDDCFVQVRNLDEHEVDDGTLSGDELEVTVSGGDLPLDLKTTSLVVDLASWSLEGPAGDYQWDPDALDLRIAYDDDPEELTLEGDLATVRLDGAGRVDFMGSRELLSFTGDMFDLTFFTRFNFDRLDVEVLSGARVDVPRGATYELALTGRYVLVDPTLYEVARDARTRLEVDAVGEIEVGGTNGGTYVWSVPEAGLNAWCDAEPGKMALIAESSLRGTHGRIDVVNSLSWGAEPSSAWIESHRLENPPPVGEIAEGRHGYSALLELTATPTDTVGTTAFSCDPGVDYLESPLGSKMTYLVRVYDGSDLIDCYATGHDPEGMRSGAYWAESPPPDVANLSVNRCRISQWDL